MNLPPKFYCSPSRVAATATLVILFGVAIGVQAQIPIPPLNNQSEFRETPAFLPASSTEETHDATRSDAIDLSNTESMNPTLEFSRRSVQILETLKPLAANYSQSIVEITNEHQYTTLGTIVSSDGLIVAKHSELAARIQCKLPDGTTHKGVLVGINPENDLALIQIQAIDLKPIAFPHENTMAAQAGEFVVSLGSDSSLVGFGIVTVIPQVFAIQHTPCPACINLGVVVSPNSESRELLIDRQNQRVTGLPVQRVYPRTAAESTGLLVGDLLVAINDTNLDSQQQLDEVARSIKVGQQLSIRVIRDGQMKTLSTRIKSFSQPTLHDRWGGGPFSNRRFGFGAVIAHDSVVDPEHCGGPLIDLDGRVVGINVARSMRAATFAIPITDVYRFVKYVRPNTELKRVPPLNR